MPLGDKGLGRLGAQLLGDNLRLQTRPRPPAPADAAPTVEHDVVIDFSQFVQGRLLTSITPTWFTATSELPDAWEGPEPCGTVLEIDGLSGDLSWLDEQQLARRLSVLINPYRRIDKFPTLGLSRTGARSISRQSAGRCESPRLGDGMSSTTVLSCGSAGAWRPDWFRSRDSDRLKRLQKELALPSGHEELCARSTRSGRCATTR